MNGWIKLHKKLLNNPIFLNPKILQLFLYCLLSANYEEKRFLWNGKEQIIPRGSFITGRKRIAEDTKLAETTIHRSLKVLSDLGMILQHTNNKFTLIEVVNYCTYQVSDLKSGQQLDSGFTNVNQFINGTTVKVDNKKGGINTDGDELYEKNKLGSEQQMDNKRTTDGQQVDTTKKLKNIKNIKNNKELKHMCDSPNFYSPDFEAFWKAYPNNKNKKGAYKNYLATLKGTSRINKATPEQLLRSAKRYAEEVKGKDPQYILHATTFLGPQERWFEYDKPLKNSNGETLREDVDKNDFMIGGGPDIDYKAYERALRGYDPYTPKRSRETDSAAGVGRTERA